MATGANQGLPRGTSQTFLGVAACLLLGYFLLSNTTPLPRPTAGEQAYAVMFDGGSSGSRVHVYTFDKKANGQFEIVTELFEQVTPGLSSFATSDAAILESAVKNIKPLLDKAVAAVPKKYQKTSPVVLRATAGLRKTGEEKANRILEQVRILFRSSPFLFRDEWVSVMDGLDEGAYAWVTINYLRGLLGKPPAETSGVLDLGGGSTQIAFAVTDEEAEMAPAYVQKRKFGPVTYNLYINSYLGYGLLEARAAVLNGTANGAKGSVCLPPAFHGHWNNIELVAEKGVGAETTSQVQCAQQVLETLFKPIQCEVDVCAIAGVPQPHVWSRHFHAFSFYFDRAVDVGLLKETDVDPSLEPRDYKEAARRVCPLSEKDVKERYHVAKEDDIVFQCMDHTYIYSLLHSLGFADDSQLVLTKKIRGYETGWCLGAAIQELMNLA